ncbi:N-acetylmuramoyl-L-alanine amidase [Enterococcus devriesei]|uniref:N-acetylmuramoyl-L-alanine amidase n=1 Tax=Enterococcus devriesei TaxID=319970 RepID=UPI0028EE1A2F|nr:N-acetylmuramoyl-L-alanine amidase [Enterococcus devriesei]
MAGEVFSNLITSVNPKVMNSGSRGGCKIDRIILHHNATTNKDVAMNTWLVGGAAGTSAHYEITPTEIIGCVGEQYAAWHAGGTGPADPPKISNPNYRSIGIENVNSTGAPSWSLDPRTITNCARLVADICKRYGIPCDRQHVLGHNEVTATACPGGMNVNEVVRLAQTYMANSGASNPKIVKSKYSQYSTASIQDNGKYTKAPAGLGVQAHMSGKGWRKWVGSGELAGSTGKSTTLEAVIVTINGDLKAVEGAIHVASKGWISCAGTFGTTGQKLQIEAIKLKLAKKYDQGKTDIVYRVHQSSIGWSAWVKNGQQAGITGKTKGIEAIQVKLIDRK